VSGTWNCSPVDAEGLQGFPVAVFMFFGLCGTPSAFAGLGVNSSASGRASEVGLLPARSLPTGDVMAPRISSRTQWSC
jgi:hypothetical protein